MRLNFNGLSNSSGISMVVHMLLRDSSRGLTARVRDIRTLMEMSAEHEDLFDDGRTLEQWTEGVHHLRNLFTALSSEGETLHLDECSYVAGEDGALGVAAHLPRRSAEVAEGDSVSAGFAALWSPNRGLRVWPRTYRLVCANGQVGRLGSHPEVLSEPNQLAKRVRECFYDTGFTATVEALRTASAIRAMDPVDVLSTIEDEAFRERALERFEVEADKSQWGLSNAVTAEARFEVHPGRRFEFERIGARIAFQPWELGRGALRSVETASGRTIRQPERQHPSLIGH